MFNAIIINEEMRPKYTYFKLYNPAAHIYITFIMMMNQSQAKELWDTYNYKSIPNEYN